ncbi:efflux RND transporter periplasmic adaptor subunit [Sphingomonas sp. 1P06PA]|uniref:efflux RND transporter periplasmic adaptor subunit n=1 Tax=Sphingomonas sp. 1P06PA TaxID=554121 RepID=UPI0039A47480
MSVHAMDRADTATTAVAGGAMDRVIETKRMDRRIIYVGAAAAVIAIMILVWLFAPRAGDQSVPAERLTISAVQKGVFDDFLPLRARSTPLVTVFLDAVEGGRVEQVLVEDGATVTKGQLLAVLSNSDLQLNLLARQADVSREINSMRSQELALTQAALSNERAVLEADLATRKAQRQYEMQRPLAERGFVAGRTFRDSQDDYLSNRDRLGVLQRTRRADDRLRSSQLAQLKASANSLNASLGIARATLDALNLRAPVTGSLSGFSIQLGQSLERGERLGQIDSPGRNKLVAGIDEFYLGRVQVGQRASVDWNGKTYRAKVTKIYPQVQNGQFNADLQFMDAEPADLQRGQTLQARLTLGDPAPALLVANGAFYNDSGGTYVFVVDPDGGTAIKRSVRLGRRNINSIEVLDGLSPGDRVITSSYSGFADKDRLTITEGK